MKYLITLIACSFLAACGDNDEDTGADTADSAEVADTGESAE